MSEGYVDGQKILLFETIHGKAEGIIGMNKANPIPFLKLAYHMLLALGEVDASARLENAVIQTLHEGILTEDMGGDASTGCCNYSFKIKTRKCICRSLI